MDESELFTAGVQDRYKVVDVLGEGGFGTVYLAEDRVLKQRVAIKVLHLANTEERARQRFIFEARTAAQLRHSGIVNVFDIVQTPDGLQQVMEYYPGGTLKDQVDGEGAIAPKRALEITRKILGALAFAHSKGIIHRDIKPANIFFAGDGSIKIGDFGLCTNFERHDHTRTGESMGTPLYMAPEQMKDAKDVDPRADIYSVGLTLYYMLTGERPVVVDISVLPASLRPMISRATAQNRDRRLSSCQEFTSMIDEVLPLIASGATDAWPPEFHRPREVYESASLDVGPGGERSDSARTRETSAIVPTARSFSIAVGAAVVSAFLTLGIVGGYITLTSRSGPGSPSAVPQAPAANPEASSEESIPERDNYVSPAMSMDEGERASALTNPLRFDGGEIPPGDGSVSGPVARGDDTGMMDSPQLSDGRRPSGGQQGMRRPPQRGGVGPGSPGTRGQVEVADLPFFFPTPALRPVGDILNRLVQWVETDGGAPNAPSLSTAQEMIRGGSQVDRANPVYPYLQGRISERLNDPEAARSRYRDVGQKAPAFMENPGAMIREVAELAGVEVVGTKAQAFLFGDPAPDLR